MNKFINIIFCLFLITSFYPFGLQANDSPEKLNAGSRQKRPRALTTAGKSNQRQKQTVNTKEEDDQRSDKQKFQAQGRIKRLGIAAACKLRGGNLFLTPEEEREVWDTFAKHETPYISFIEWVGQQGISCNRLEEHKKKLEDAKKMCALMTSTREDRGECRVLPPMKQEKILNTVSDRTIRKDVKKTRALTAEQKKRRFRAKIVEECRERAKATGTPCILTQVEAERIRATFLNKKRLEGNFNQWLKDHQLLLDTFTSDKEHEALAKRDKEEEEACTQSAEEDEVILDSFSSAQPVNNFDSILASGSAWMTVLEDKKAETSDLSHYSCTLKDPFACPQLYPNFPQSLHDSDPLHPLWDESIPMLPIEEEGMSDAFTYKALDLSTSPPFVEAERPQSYENMSNDSFHPL